MNKAVSIMLAGLIFAVAAFAQSTTSQAQNSDSLKYKTVRTATKIAVEITEAQVDFVNEHYDYVQTPYVAARIRKMIRKPVLLLYRSIQDGWTNSRDFDWKHMDANENMFSHRKGKRIETKYNSFLMEPGDLVDPGDENAMNHWINYYAATASRQIYDHSYDGLFIDSAAHRLRSSVVFRKMPDSHSDSVWRDQRYASMKFIKSQLPDKLVIFNGLHGGNGAEKSLEFTDGGMWETLGYSPDSGKYDGEKRWIEAIELVDRHKDTKLFSLVSKRNGFTTDTKARMFVFASYLLVSSENVALTIADLDFKLGSQLLYYPEYELDLGKPLGDYRETKEGYRRDFEKGFVMVNPDSRSSCKINPESGYCKVVPVGGGQIQKDGTYEGSLGYEEVKGGIDLPPVSGLVLVKKEFMQS